MKIVIPDRIDLIPKHFDIIRSLGSVTVYNDIPKSENEIIRRVRDAEIITANWFKVNRKIIDGAKKLRFIVIPAVGYEWVDVKYATRKGIKVLNCPTHNSASVANLTVGFILAITRKIKAANRSIENGQWIRMPYGGIELEGKTLGLIGYGNIGKRVGTIAKSLGMKIRYANSKTPGAEIDRIIRESDIISLHMPLTDKTRRMIDGRRIGMMKRSAYLINVSRGGIIDQEALLKALKSRQIAGAALDVFENEPFKETKTGVPKEIVRLAGMANVITTPHIAYYTKEMYIRMGDEIIADIRSCIKNRPINVVN